MNRGRLRQVVLGVIAADFPLIYVGAVTFDSAALAAAALAVMAAAIAVAALAY